jgi:NurA-like 5'-3' nuclease
MDEQIIQVEFDSELVENYKTNYIMEEEGIGAEIGEIYDEQTSFNTDTIGEILGEGAEVENVY